MIQEKLKNDTRSQHEELERIMFAHSIMDGTLSLQDYKTLLITNYLVHAEHETSLFDRLTDQTGVDLLINRRRKLSALAKDLHETGMVPPENADRAFVNADDKNELWALGALYVLEGATLGGHVIVKKLSINSSLNHLSLNFNYYRIYGDDLMTNWKSFCAILNRQSESDYPSILAGARSIFQSYRKKWEVIQNQSIYINLVADI